MLRRAVGEYRPWAALRGLVVDIELQHKTTVLVYALLPDFEGKNLCLTWRFCCK